MLIAIVDPYVAEEEIERFKSMGYTIIEVLDGAFPSPKGTVMYGESNTIVYSEYEYA